ncbi:hypothetical protein GP486_005557 [Trichoglossum hirsutum]|uniref:VWFA domain-containing protein n=1 Tax=Trichoglossum hirsutum TaxID=265104 RepID=A0A9P8L948_9PEZI|nr:hypothetical protein GP486_005557 [Trichoglossum hirsutum]
MGGSSNKAATVSVRNLPPLTSREDVENFFNGSIPGCSPLVGPLVKDSHVDALCTTVTLQTGDACKLAYAKLNNQLFRATRGGEGDVSISSDFMGVNTVAEHNDPQFDLYFVHGLGGHAFDSWAFVKKNQSHESMKMWPRDLLPNRFLPDGPRGRFSTIGYNANVVVQGGNTTIASAARNLLYELRNDRPQGCMRPIFFCCHSLGGLVVAQALVFALDEKICKDEDKYLNRLVKGVVFFGTPFWGSFNADTMSPFVSALAKVNPHGVNSALIKSLKTGDRELASLVEHFSQVRYRHDIDVKIFTETLQTGILLVTHPGSAGGPFTEFVDSIPINASHVGMVKFSHEQDPKFRPLAESIVRMVRRKPDLGVPGAVTLSQSFPASRPSNVFNGGESSYTSQRQQATLARSDTIHTELPILKAYGSQSHPQQFMSGRSRVSVMSQNGSSGPVRAMTQPDPIIATQGRKPLKVRAMPSYSHRIGTEDSFNLQRLENWDVVFVIDDTGSMQLPARSGDDAGQTRWDMLAGALEYIANVAACYDDDGVDVHFLIHRNLDKTFVKDGQTILNLLSQVNLSKGSGGTFLEPVLNPILSQHIIRYKDYYEALRRRDSNPQIIKPLNLIVLTDGAADDEKATTKMIEKIAKELDDMYAPSFQIGIQFVQVGDDKKATEFLQYLDDHLENEFHIRDMVDTQNFNDLEEGEGNLFGDKLVKILIAAMDRRLDG